MRYASIRELDISNGEGVGVALFVQGCPFNPHCFNCFNSETWDFNGGKEWTEETKNKFMKLIDRPYIKRVSFLGGECLSEQNLDEVLKLTQQIHNKFPDKIIWLYTGYSIEDLNNYPHKEVIKNCDVIIDGPYVKEKRNITIPFRGSTNQRIIDVQKSFKENKICMIDDSEFVK